DENLHTDMTVADVRAKVASIASEKEPDELARAGMTDGPKVSLWPYTWGRTFQALSVPLDLLYHAGVTRTIVLGSDHLSHLPPRIIFAGTHRSYPDLLLLRHGLTQTAARRFADRLLVATSASRYAQAGTFGPIGTLL